MKRREFITLVGGATAWPFAARAQQSANMRRIGLLTGLAEDNPEEQARLAGFRKGLESQGWSEGRNLRIDYRFAPGGGTDQLQTFSKELVGLRPEVILADGTPNAAALRHETRTIPIVFVNVSDPIGSGFIDSLARPGHNLTGFALIEGSVAGKWLSMLKEIAPSLARVALLGNPKNTPYDYFLQATQAAAKSLAIQVVPSRIETAADIERAIESFAQMPHGALILPPDFSITGNGTLIVALAARYRLPAIYPDRRLVAAGGLMSYVPDRVDIFRRAAFYVDRMLRGDKPEDLPVQAPTKYETVVNLRTANALGLTVPPGLLVAADEVIEQ